MVVAAIKCNIIIENEEVSDLINHWPKSTPCTMCKIDPTIRSAVSNLDWRALRNEIPSVIVSALCNSLLASIIYC